MYIYPLIVKKNSFYETLRKKNGKVKDCRLVHFSVEQPENAKKKR